MSKEKTFTEVVLCGHCGNKAPMEIVSTFRDLQEHWDERSQVSWEEGNIYELDRCPACSNVSLRKAFWHDGYMDPSEVKFEVLHPSRKSIPAGLPKSVSKAYESAMKVQNVDPNAYGVLLGRVLEFVCENRDAKGDSLATKLKDLALKGEIPTKLVDVANSLRQLRNVAAHASLGELTGAEIPVLDNLTRAILEYVYTAPLLIREAEDRLKRLKEGKRKTKKS